MSSSDDECEAVPRSVSKYQFEVGKDEPISFAELPVQWKNEVTPDGEKKRIFLRGSHDNDLQIIYKQVISWKFDLSNEKPEISVLTKDNHWIRLLNPRKAFEKIIRTILITVHCLHFVKRNPHASHRALWDHLGKVFSWFESRASENDLVDHIPLIDEAVKRDAALAKSKLLVTFLEEKPSKRKAFSEDIGITSKYNFIVDDATIGENEDDASDEEDNCFDTVCAICDNGGSLLCCEGKCIRSFHPTVEDGFDSTCESLGYTHAQMEAMKSIDFYCKNCEYKLHQCYVCGELGSSNDSSGAAEVFRCVNGACGHFYHPGCVAKLLRKGDKAAAAELQKKIAAGEQFACPLHRCHVCKEVEVKSDHDLQFAVCRRCPKAYHRKCLPSDIAFQDDKNTVQRAWEDLIPNRILIYCLDHEIDEDLETPVRNHIKFPGFELKNKKEQPLEAYKPGVVSKKRNIPSEDAYGKKCAAKPSKRVDGSSLVAKQVDLSEKRGDKLSGQRPSIKQKVASKNSRLNKSNETTLTTEDKMSLGEQLFSKYFGSDSDSVKSRQVERVDSEQELSQKAKPKGANNLFNLDAEAKQRILAMTEDASSSITLEEIVEKHRPPSTHAYSSKYAVDKNVTLGKVEGSVEAVRAALQKLEGGEGTVTDAKSVCGTDLLVQVMKWKNKLRVYLSPFLYGMRYTSFGRHFTKLEKLKEIVDILHSYVKDEDMIVDFCCGSNDFSCLMKSKLDKMGKSCSYRNYDIVQAKNSFNFEKRDWMTVQPNELLPGSKLIMGLNPPFGVNASLANQFINKALQFKPKLLILIVPQETQQLDKKNFPYDLIWEDDQMLVGKSFYLPGSVDVNDNQMEDWNVNSPPLYLWSRPDWTPTHKAIAKQHGHLSKDKKGSSLQERQAESHVSDAPNDPNNLDGYRGDQCDDQNLVTRRENLEKETGVATSPKEELPREVHVTEGDRNHHCQKNQSGASSEEYHSRSKRKRESVSSSEDRSAGKRSVPGPPYRNVDGHQLGNDHSPRSVERPEMDVPKENYRLPKSNSVSASRPYSQTRHDADLDDDLLGKYCFPSEESYSSLTNRGSRPNYGFRAPYSLVGYPGGVKEVRDYRSYETGDGYGTGRRDIPRSWDQNYTSNLRPGLQPLYGHQFPPVTSTYVGMSTSAIDRYAPQLNELNHARINHVGSGLPYPETSSVFRPLGPRPGFRSGSFSFAPGPYHHFPQHNSSGWLNE